jgi:hypothetical protein
MQSNKVEYCRKSRDKSISPSISFDTSQNLAEWEKKEKIFYNVLVADMTKEIFLSYDDLIRNINFFLACALKSKIKTISEAKWEVIYFEFFEANFKRFTDSFDNGENMSNLLLRCKVDEALVKYLQDKNKRKNRIPIFNEAANDTGSIATLLSSKVKFEENKKRLAKNLSENIRLRVELALERRIEQNNSQNFEKIKEKFNYIQDQIKNKPDMNYIDKNVDIMSNKLKIMRRELNSIN